MKLEDAELWLRQCVRGNLVEPQTKAAIEEVLGALYEYEKYIDIAHTYAFDYNDYYDEDTKMGDPEGLVSVIKDVDGALQYARGVKKPTNLEKWKMQQAKYCLEMDTIEFRDFLDYNDEDKCNFCAFSKCGICGLTDEQAENLIGCVDGIEEWCEKEVE